MTILLACGFVFVLLLCSRELVCWYFKINQTVRLLEKIAGVEKIKK
jgi:hypothetical protein